MSIAERFIQLKKIQEMKPCIDPLRKGQEYIRSFLQEDLQLLAFNLTDISKSSTCILENIVIQYNPPISIREHIYIQKALFNSANDIVFPFFGAVFSPFVDMMRVGVKRIVMDMVDRHNPDDIVIYRWLWESKETLIIKEKDNIPTVCFQFGFYHDIPDTFVVKGKWQNETSWVADLPDGFLAQRYGSRKGKSVHKEVLETEVEMENMDKRDKKDKRDKNENRGSMLHFFYNHFIRK